MILTIIVTQVGNRFLDYNSKTIFRIRLIYTLSMALVQFTYFLIRYSIMSINDQSEVVSTNPLVEGLKKNGGDGIESVASIFGLSDMVNQLMDTSKTNIKVKEYDLEKAKTASSAYFSAMCFTYFLHFFQKMSVPMLVAPIGPLMQTFSDPLFQIHIMKKAPTGTLSRPFKKLNMIEQMKLSQKEEVATKSSQDDEDDVLIEREVVVEEIGDDGDEDDDDLDSFEQQLRDNAEDDDDDDE
mmetsp:Transcript_20859/g.27123  ORF Transcript_20859/g.27123 Transcript_20859/m.27123 type:complete len:240 (-) Transcript_20859:101-820(-)